MNSFGKLGMQRGRRPFVVLSRQAAIDRLGRALVAPCTTNLRRLPSEVELDPDVDPIPRHCAVDIDSIESVSSKHIYIR